VVLAVLGGLAISAALFRTAGRSWEAVAWLVTGLTLTTIVGLLFVTEERRAARVEKLVRERTAEVHVLNEQLARRVLERGAQLEELNRDFSEQLAQRAQTEAALRESEEKFRAISERSLDAILILDGEDGRILRANPAAEQALGYPVEALAGRHVSTLFPPEPSPPREVLLERLRVHGAAFEEQAFRRADGRTVPMDVTATVVPWDGGQAIVATLRDVSERTEAQRALREREEQLRQAHKMEAVGRLAGGVAHDFNNLLMVVSGYAQLLLRRVPPGDPLHKPAEEISKAAERAAALTRQLLSFGRKQVVQPRVLDANATVTETESLLRRTIGEDIELRTRLDARPAWVRTDAGQLEQVLMNLVLNARDAMPGGGRLTIETGDERVESDAALPAGPYVRLTVSDTGAGIPPEIRDKIFDPFFTTKEKGKGTGLGLATVYGIVQQWGGQVRLESEPGRGATFHVLLPRAAAPRDGASGPVDSDSVPGGSETILLVEDEPAVRELTREILETSGYNVLEAEDPDEAVRLCQQPGPIDLLLTDVVMPRVSGRELSLRLGGLRPGLKVLFMSGYTDDEILRRGVIEGTAFLQKPFGPDALTRKVRELLDAS